MRTLVGVIVTLLWLYFLVLIARLVLDYVQMFARQWRPQGVVLVLCEVVYSLTDPPLKALRRVIPPLRLGRISLDLSFLVLILAIQILIPIVTRIGAGLPS
ncbi:MAG TPA: YggT family protein [Actinomycetes bacterium]|nr:YggT family protein [Actinomycetes bacterium]